MKMVNKMPSYNEFKSMVLNKGYDIDGYYGNQCWDGYAKYCQYLGYGIAHCTNTGYVRDLWELRKTNGILNYFNEINVMQAGDVAVFKEVAGWTPLSHVAIFDHDAGNGYGWFLGQNQGGVNGAFNLVKLPYSAIYDTAFRPKCFVAQPKKNGWKYENNQWYFYKNNEALKGWHLINDKWYCFEDNGCLKYGWTKHKDNWYYLNEKGEMATGNCRIDGKDYVFDSKGILK